jgi:hypothetical protein
MFQKQLFGQMFYGEQFSCARQCEHCLVLRRRHSSLPADLFA